LNQEGTLDKYGLTTPNSHVYLRGVGAPDDAAVFGQKFLDDWNELMDGMNAVGFTKQQIESMLKACAAVLLIGDTEFKPAGDGVEVVASPKLDKAAAMIEVEVDALRNALKYTTLYTRGEATQKLFNMDQAKEAKEALSKAIFNNVFMWVFDVCNVALADTTGASVVTNTMGVLDIFGFEVFKLNSIEQMCIDVTNEQLQHFFNHHIFEMEQVEYLKEGVDVSKISYVDNQSTLDLFLKKQPQGIFSLLDDESKFPKGTDMGFVEKCAGLKAHPSGAFAPAKSSQDLSFTVTHYAGPVTYSGQNFLEKNRDTVPTDVVACIDASTSSYIKLIFTERVDPTAPPHKEGSKKVISTLVSNFKRSLEELVSTLSACAPSFVRCLKPNGKQLPSNWDVPLVTRQLKYAGVLATITIRKMGYSFRLSFADFVKRYKVMAYKFNENPEESKETCLKILNKIKMTDYQVGTTKVFMKYFHSDHLATEAKKHSSALQFLQKVVKGNLARSRYDALLKERRECVKKVEAFCQFTEDIAAKPFTKMAEHAAEDAKEGGKRDWLKNVKTQALQAEEAKRVEAEEVAAALRIAEQEPKVIKSKCVNGYLIHMRNEHLTLKKGPLTSRYRKKLDANSGRFYFKDVDTKTTSWIDPRSKDTRKMDPLECVDDELPYGWDEAESEDGVKFYIDHTTNTHHKEHPRVAFQRRKNALDKDSAEKKAVADKKLAMINELRSKRRRLHTQMVSTIDADERKDLQGRIETLDDTIMSEAHDMNSVQLASKKLAERFERMRAHQKESTDIDDVLRRLGSLWVSKALKRAPTMHNS
jgi:myosin-3